MSTPGSTIISRAMCCYIRMCWSRVFVWFGRIHSNDRRTDRQTDIGYKVIRMTFTSFAGHILQVSYMRELAGYGHNVPP